MNANQKKIKILITLPSLNKDPGGVASYYNSILPHMYKSNDFEIEIFEMGSTAHGNKNMLFHPVIDQIKFINKIKSIKPDIVHVNPSLNLKSFLRDGFFIFWAKKQKIGVIVFFRGWTKKFERKINGILNFFFNITYKKVNFFIVLAKEFKHKLLEWGVKSPIHIATTNVDDSLVKNFSIIKKITRIKKSQIIRILFLSRLEKDKGVFETIDAFKLLLNKKYNISLSIAGDGSITKKIIAYIENLSLNDKIFMFGYLKGEGKINAFAEHDIYCFPTSYDEGMPNSVLEAMAFGMPVITTPVGGIKDFFKNGKMGYLCNTTKPEDIAEKLEIIINNKNELCETAKYNYNYAKQNFMASIVADKLLSIYSRYNCHKTDVTNIQSA